MAIVTGHLVLIVVRAVGALRTASPPPLNPRVMLFAFMAAVVVMLAERAVHHDLTVIAGVLSNGAIWGRYYDWLVAKHSSPQTITNNRATILDFWKFLEVATPRVTGPDGAKHERQWHQARPKDLERYLERRCHKGGAHAGEMLARGTQAIYEARVTRLYRWASAKRLLPGRNPFEDVVPRKRPGRRPRALPLSAVGELLVEVSDQRRVHMMVQLAYYQMLRIGEICRLSVEDIRFDTDPPLVRVDGKGGVEAWMPINPALIPALRAWLVSRPANGPLIPNYLHPGRHLNETYAANLVARVMRPIVGDSAHALRHTGAQQLRRLTRDPFLVKEALRHQSLGTVEFYIAPEPTMLAEGLSMLPDPLAPDPLAPELAVPT